MVHENTRIHKRYIFIENVQFSKENDHFQPTIGQIRFKMVFFSSFFVENLHIFTENRSNTIQCDNFHRSCRKKRLSGEQGIL